MGAYFFYNCDIGPITSEEDITTLKHSATSGSDITFSLQQSNIHLIKNINNFFSYLYEKSPFTLGIKKLKFTIYFSVFIDETFILHLERCINKYLICKKFNKPNEFRTLPF